MYLCNTDMIYLHEYFIKNSYSRQGNVTMLV